MLGWPGGQAIVVIAGLVIMVVAVALAWRGLKTDFEKHLNTGRMSRTTFTAVRRLGQVGYIARGAVFFLIGILVVKAAMDHQPGKAQGFDVALQEPRGCAVRPGAAGRGGARPDLLRRLLRGRGALPPALSYRRRVRRRARRRRPPQRPRR